jgi:hypothetical protein
MNYAISVSIQHFSGQQSAKTEFKGFELGKLTPKVISNPSARMLINS